MFAVTITEMLEQTVTVVADTTEEAERIVSLRWRNCEHVLAADQFVSVEFSAVPMNEQDLG
jgi:hypothetical protein